MADFSVKQVRSRQILDSRGNPTVESEVELECGAIGRAAVPSGASTGKFEAVELRDGDKNVYRGKGVNKAVKNANTVINAALKGVDAQNTYAVDRIMIDADGTENKGKLGANAMLSVSLAAARASANALGIPLYAFIGGCSATRLPVPMMNILNGGAHASNNVDVQEFMIMPIGARSFEQALQWCAEVYHTLGSLLKSVRLATSVGDEGGFAPNLESDEHAVKYVLDAIKCAGFVPGTDFAIALDAAASEWKGSAAGVYRMPKSGAVLSTDTLIEHWMELSEKYPIYSIEDGLDEEDWDGWAKLTQKLGNRVQLVGDDLFVTNVKRIQKGAETHCGNSVLIKPNQIGTLSETIEAVKIAKNCGYTAVISHRSGETEDTLIADLAVALNAGQIKSGAPNRSERVAKYNRLLKIERELGVAAYYPRSKAFNIDR